MLVLVSLAVALGAYPIIRRLTKRLEALQRGVERWGAGELGTRVPVEGGDEVAFLAERFNQAAERIEHLLSSHKALLANASHELRSPLARIRMGLALMGDDSSAQAHEIRRSLQELDQLIDEILLASRLDAAQGEPEPMELLDLTGLAAEECARVGAELQAAPAPAPASAGTSSNATRLMILISGLTAGPAVSLYGSPTVSPVTAALCVSEPLPPKLPSSMYFLALSQAPPPVHIEIATNRPVTIVPISTPPSARIPAPGPSR
jgi:signal transduction histidine kinase